MFKLKTSIKKEFLILLNDKVGLSIMFGLPIVLVFLMTIIQDSAYKIVNENKVKILISNQDKGTLGTKFIHLIEDSKSFEIELDNQLSLIATNRELLKRDKLIALYIPEVFSASMEEKANYISKKMLVDLGLASDTITDKLSKTEITFFHDPILQDNYASSIMGLISTFLGSIEQNLMVERVYHQMGFENPKNLEHTILENRTKITKIASSTSNKVPNPNSTQHNVPAWTIFAMFFMVLSLGSNITQEKNSGSFIRLKTIPTHYSMILISKMLVYIFAALLQVIIIFSIGKFIFPYIGLPDLEMPTHFGAFVLIVVLSSIAAVSYAVMIGSISKTPEQNNGIGSISVMIFAALGGIWVPLFALPDYMVFISNFSPMRWCLEGFYLLFLSDNGLKELTGVVISIIIFIIVCQVITFGKLKHEKLI
ncbi:MAG: ABC transporter permease [Cyclobacteriaceae bacterium]|nr:ABC transporter permease [Cyclobacteriaceae bacterium]